ncbi:LacI family DNA-binding transcriptional regulator [Variovorax sp. OV329]|uniref:LacI family DNA-binding transcriptional regulator n=1 Tax=Variovorax sp. OV329 TaxID=1882825 RepID=UPI001C3182F0|nr:LacI family DNA-binding transcriptional regulator [Variovorax sp. OV329]
MSDIAQLAGVSASTVSRALRNPEAVSDALRAKVNAAIEQTGYVPNRMAGGLAASRTRTVGVIVPSLINTFFAATVEAMADRLEPHGYQLMVGTSGYSPEREEALATSFLSWLPSAMVLTGTHHARGTLKRLVGLDIPIVEMWELGDNALDTTIGFSHRDVGREAAQHLFERGRRRIAFAGAAIDEDRRAWQRREGFLDAVRATQHQSPISHVIPQRASVEAGAVVFRELLEMHPEIDGAFFSNDALMLGAMFECQRRGITVPQQIAMIGFGDLDYGAWSSPRLSTIRPPRREIGLAVADHLLKRFNDSSAGGEVIDLGFQLVPRESS